LSGPSSPPTPSSPQTLAEQLLSGDRRALARALTLAERGGPEAHALLAAVYPRTGGAHTVGVTGPPGAGKSSLVAALAAAWRARGITVGIIAVDPSSPYTGGAILGDRIRMQGLGGDAGVFIRSMASRGRLGGLARATDDAIALLDAAGFAVVLVETVGAGQGEVDIARSAQSTVVVEVPGLGDDVQALKAGLLEAADLLVVNKADRAGADQALRQLRAMLALGGARHEGWTPPVLSAVATTGEGADEIVEALAAHRSFLQGGDALARRASAQAAQALAAAVGELALERIRADEGAYQAALDEIAARRASPHAAAARLLGPPPPDTT
jgi:LAO/AO transport system kinase